MQSSVCAKVRGLLTIFLAPQMPWQLGPWLSRQQTTILGIPWQYAQICHKTGRGCCQDIIGVPLVSACHPFLACPPGGMTSSDRWYRSCWISEVQSWSWSWSCCSCWEGLTSCRTCLRSSCPTQRTCWIWTGAAHKQAWSGAPSIEH